MAKKKTSKPIEPEVTEAVIEEEIVTDEIVEEVIEEVVSEPEVIEEAPVAKQEEASNQFVYTQLKAINKLNNPAKARRLAERVLRNRKR